VSVPFTVSGAGNPSHTQKITIPASGTPAFAGRPLVEFTGTLPYASELFGVYQPLSGWLGAHTSMAASAAHPNSAFANLDSLGRFKGDAARNLTDSALKALAEHYGAAASGGLSPVGLVNLFREYFFEFDTFLGPPAGHIWVSPGGTVEVVETSTRRALVEKVAELSEEVSRKTEESTTDQEDVAEAVKEENSTDTKLGVSATGGVNAKIYHADVSASFGMENSVKRGSEATHKRTRVQTAKASSEIKRNFKTTFKTVTETTDTSSRRYVLQNTSEELVNYELRRKMRKVGVQLQHIGTRLCWQVFLDEPGKELGLGDMVHVVEAPDLTAVPKPEKLPLPEPKEVPFHFDLPFRHEQGPDEQEAEETYLPEAGNHCRGIKENTGEKNDIIQFCFPEIAITEPTPPGYELHKIASINHHSAQIEYVYELKKLPDDKNFISLRLTFANYQGKKSLPFDVKLQYLPKPETTQKIIDLNKEAEDAYKKEIERLQHEAYGRSVRERLRLVSSMRHRSPEDMRSEERRTVFRNLIRRLEVSKHYPDDPKQLAYPEAEEIQQFFDVEEMLYFVAPDFWRPSKVPPPVVTKDSVGRYPVPDKDDAASTTVNPLPPQGQTVAGWYSRADKYTPIGNVPPPFEWRVNYLVTEQTQPAPLGSSLGWLIQIDGDERRNEFLNAAWAKAVLPVRPGQELAALSWLIGVEGEAGLGVTYEVQSGDPADFGTKKVGEVLALVSKQLNDANKDYENTKRSEKVFETGFDPLAGGFKPAEPYQVFDQWVEVLPTEQVAAVAVKYDPKTGQQL
jgi:hypothetical protein